MTPQERQHWTRLMGARQTWWESRAEAPIDPDRPIVDAHLHLWKERNFPDPTGAEPLRTSRYLSGDFDAGGHRVEQFIYIECGSGYFLNGQEYLRPVGESGFAAEQSKVFADEKGPELGASIAYADLRSSELDAIIDAHSIAACGLLRGIRQSGARLDDASARLLAGAAEARLYADAKFRRGLAKLAERAMVFDAFVFHHQLGEVLALARATPTLTLVVDHMGGPVGYDGPGSMPEGWRQWIEKLADLPNVMMKLGGAASLVTGYDAAHRAPPPSSEEFVRDRGPLFHHCIDRFGPERCMFESNFPVDSTSISYGTLWNAYKLIASDYSVETQTRLLSETARRTYKLPAKGRN